VPTIGGASFASSFSNDSLRTSAQLSGWETLTEQDFAPESVKKQMRDRTDRGDIMKPKQPDLPEQEKNKKWRTPDW
jgi:hypothetical protein